MNDLNSICVFCGSSTGRIEKYSKEAWKLGQVLAKEKITLVFGGGQVGLMGVIADSVIKHGGKAIGVIPGFLEKKELAHKGVKEMIIVDTMHQRKQKMADLSSGFIAMPGGMGTLEELSEILTWSQLGLHRKPFGILNVKGYFNSLLSFFDQMVDKAFLHSENQKLLVTENKPKKLLRSMREWNPVIETKWLDRENT